MRQAHFDGAVDGVCERSVWCFEQQQASWHRHCCRMCHPGVWDARRARVTRDLTRWGLAPRPWMLTGGR